jgi:DNA end-binding protein Ku
MDALKKSIASETTPKCRKRRKAAAGQKEMLLSIAGKRGAERSPLKPKDKPEGVAG